MKNAVAIYHVAFEDAGTLEPVLEKRGIKLTYLQAGRDDLSPALNADLVLILGGPIGVYETDRYPFLRVEMTLIGKLVEKNTPIVGICLGAQALAHVLGAPVYPGKEKELGWDTLIL
ncbi:MAG: gamma-glutamyl-gamma-aminobutyrate hydrolase family protein, partial [Pseudomonadota bacterium]